MIVMKFGGTSVQDAAAIDRAADHRPRPPAAAAGGGRQRHGQGH